MAVLIKLSLFESSSVQLTTSSTTSLFISLQRQIQGGPIKMYHFTFCHLQAVVSMLQVPRIKMATYKSRDFGHAAPSTSNALKCSSHCLPTYRRHLKHFYVQQQLLLSAHLSHRNSVCLSVCPSHGWISQKRCKLGSPNFHRRLPGTL